MTSNPDRKIVCFGDDAQMQLADGIRIGADAVASSLGPAGKNTLLERKFRTPELVDDGYKTINNLILDNELQNLGVTSLVDAANKASEYAGDGTSTTIVLLRAIYDAGRKLVGVMGFGKVPFQIKKEIAEAKKTVLERLKEKSKQIKTKEEIKGVALAAYDDEETAEVVADMVEKVGQNGIILVEEGWGRETETEIITGMRFAGKLPHQLFANTAEEGLNLEGLPILVTDFDFVNLNDLIAIVKDVNQTGEQGLVIVANKYEKMAIEQIIRTNLFNAQNRVPFRVWLIKTPSFTPGEFEDFATFVGARYFSKEKGDKVLEAKVGDLGRAESLKITKEGDGIIMGGQGKKEDVDKRIEDLKLRLKEEKVKMIKGRLEQRIGSLASAVGIIKVASPSEGETEHIRLKTKNAVKSSQAAVAEGAVRGGGLALKEISDELEDGNILKEALKAPYEAIQRNAGGKLDIPENLYDATKVIRTAIEQACSQAYLLINVGTMVAFRSERDNGDAAQIIAGGVGNIKVGRKTGEYD